MAIQFGSTFLIGTMAATATVVGVTAYTLKSNNVDIGDVKNNITPSTLVSQNVETQVTDGPRLDVVRVDQTGSAIVAGTAEPNSLVDVLLDGQSVAQAQTDANGAFSVFVTLDLGADPQEMTVEQRSESGTTIASTDKVLILPSDDSLEKPAPKLVIAKSNSVQLVQPKAEIKVASAQTQSDTPRIPDVELSLQTIEYDKDGEVTISGEGTPSEYLRVYVDEEPTEVQPVPSTGKWQVVLPDVTDGLYTLRIDSIDQTGTVTKRIESPFKREAKATLKETFVDSASPIVTIQPGFTLWQVASDKYGNGLRYVQIYEANRAHIRDPNLIYPGQVFELPG